MKKFLVGSVAAAAFCSAPAIGADMPVKAPVYKAPPAVISWNGCYVGGNAGGVWGDAKFIWDANPIGFVFPADHDAAGTGNIKPSGFTGGGQLGCNYQANNVVWGIEGDINYTGLSGSRSAISPSGGGNFPVSESFSSDWLSTVRGRVGLVNGPALFYATGGLAIANVKYSDSITIGAVFNSASASQTRTGWTVGGGVEWTAGSNWTIKLEYLYADLGKTNYTALNSNPVLFPNSTIAQDHKLTENIVRLGLNYKFNWGKDPVVAKY